MVNQIAHVVLIANGVNVNEFLVSEGHARVSEENYMSKVKTCTVHRNFYFSYIYIYI